MVLRRGIASDTTIGRDRADAIGRQSFGSNASGSTLHVVLVGNSNAGDITPTTVYGTESS